MPIIPDEARTFGMDALFKEVKIYAPLGQLYEPVDSKLMLTYSEAKDGQILEEGITEAGGMADFTAAGTAYATWGQPMIPFFIFYSMFGFQRVGDLIWAFGDMRGRGFLLGGTAGRTTLLGEGLQHDDGHSLLLASTVPNVRRLRPGVRLRGGGHRRGRHQPDVRARARGHLLLPDALQRELPDAGRARTASATGSCGACTASPPHPRARRAGPRCSSRARPRRRRLEAQRLLADDHDVAVELWSATSYKALREDALSVERWNRLHPGLQPRSPYVTEVLDDAAGPIVAVTDFMKAVPDQVARWVPGHFMPLGTDGFGRSDTREALRRHFETDAAHVVVAVLDGLRATGEAKAAEVEKALAHYGIDADAPDPRIS